MGVTVITASLPVRRDLLREAIASVAAQTVPCSHFVMVDAGRGVADVRNELVAAAQTEWVAFLDDDDRLDPNHIETLLERSANADVVIPKCRFDGPPLPAQFCNRTYDRDALRAHGIFPITVLARRQTVLDAGGFATESVYEDWELWNAMADQGARFVNAPAVTWTYVTRHIKDRRTTRLAAR